MTVLTAAGHHRGMQHDAIAPLLERGQDSVSPSGMSPGLDVYCGYDAGAPGYRNGGYSNMAAIRARFPGKKYVSVGYDAIDIEPGLASPSAAPGFVRGWTRHNTVKPVVYASRSQMGACQSYLNGAGIHRSSYFLWVAEWDGNPAIPAGYDAKQYASHPTEDQDSFEDYMFAATTPPAPTFSVTPSKLHRTVTLRWAAIAKPVDHYVITCVPASPHGAYRTPGSVRELDGLVLPSSGAVKVTVTGITARKPYPAAVVHIPG
jgi:hypothetical protein